MTKKKEHSEKQSLPWPAIVGILLLLVSCVLSGIYWDRTSNIEQIQFRGYEHVSLQQLKQRVSISENVNPDSLNFEAIINQVKKIPYIETVQLKVHPGGTIVVNISERKPIALMMNNGYRCLVDSNGVKLKFKSFKVHNLPLLYGFKIQPMSDTLNTNEFNKVSAFYSNCSGIRLRMPRSAPLDGAIKTALWH